MADRPLSPHLSVYRWQLTMMLSIIHRGTGVVLSMGAIIVIWWLYAVAAGPGPFDQVQGFLASWFGVLVLLGLAFSVFYHLFNGIRHLLWDIGWGLEIERAYATGWTVVVLTALATAASAFMIFGGAA